MDLRNIAIIAHVDHGKTTLVDELLKQSGAFRENQARRRARDGLQRPGARARASPSWPRARRSSGRARGSTSSTPPATPISAARSSASCRWSTASCCWSTRPKGRCRRPSSSPPRRWRSASGRSSCSTRSTSPTPSPTGCSTRCSTCSPRSTPTTTSSTSRCSTPPAGPAGRSPSSTGRARISTPLFDLIVNHVPAAAPDRPTGRSRSACSARRSEADPFLGRILTGRVESGKLKVGATVKALRRDGQKIEQFRVSKILAFRGLERNPDRRGRRPATSSRSPACRRPPSPTRSAHSAVDEPLPAQPIDPPTISVTFGINDSPLAGRDGDKVPVPRHPRPADARGRGQRRDQDRGHRRAATPSRSSGRGELQLGVLIETMRREGFELSISRPQVHPARRRTAQRSSRSRKSPSTSTTSIPAW